MAIAFNFSALRRWAPPGMLIASVVMGLALDDFIPADIALAIPLIVALFLGRAALAFLDPLVGWRAGAVLFITNLALTLAGSLFNPLLCIYAFAGYLDLERYVAPQWRRPAVVATGLIIAVGQAGGLPGLLRIPLVYVGLAVVNVAIALLMFSLAREREEAAAALVRAHEANAELQRQLAASARERGIAEERARLSRELHDTVAQGIVGVIRQLEALAPTSLDEATATRVERATTSARDCLMDARRAVRALAPKELSQRSLPEAVHDLARTWSRANRIAIEVDTDEAPAASPHEDVVVRVVQEALTNIARHASAESVRITLCGPGPAVEVLIEDDGIGFDPGQPVAGLGLAGMAARVTAAGGELSLDSRPGSGCRVLARLP